MTDAEIIAAAKAYWAERELTFPRFVRQTWEQGTWLARACTIRDVMNRDSGSDAKHEDPRSGAEPVGSQSGGEAASPEIQSTPHPENRYD